MAYQVLARKWRPQDFTEVVGQAPIVTALGNALTEGTIAQAYLFSGIRGIGKTSVARLMAKALNCERGPATNPCNECATCEEITAGSDLDVIEVDAATYSKVEQIRELTESLKYGPARDRYKVVVLDEIHRLSRQAFDALLKIVEEPPKHLVFIFATTEIEAVPATILSRCQEFHFRRVPSLELAAHLRSIAEREEIEVSDTALRLIARAGDGSVRDAVALVDQLAIYGGGTIADEEAERVLGGLDSARFVKLLEAITGGDSAEVSAIVRDVEAEGWDPRQIYTQFLTYCRDALHLALGGEVDGIDLPREEATTLQRLAAESGYENLLRILHQLLQSESPVRRSEFGVLALEIALLRAAELPKLTRIEDLLAGRSGGAGAAGAGAAGPKRAKSRRRPSSGESSGEDARKAGEGRERPAPAKPTAEEAAPSPSRPNPAPAPDAAEASPATSEDPEAAPADKAEPPPTEDPVSAPAEEGAAPTIRRHTDGGEPDAGREPDDERRRPAAPAAARAPEPPPAGDGNPIETVLEHVSRERQSLAAHLGTSENLAFDGGELLIFAPKGDSWLESALSRARNRGILDQAVSAVFGAEARWRLVEAAERPPKQDRATPAAADGASSATDHPMVQTVLDVFGGTVESEETALPGSEDR